MQNLNYKLQVYHKKNYKIKICIQAIHIFVLLFLSYFERKKQVNSYYFLSSINTNIHYGYIYLLIFNFHFLNHVMY